MTSVGTRTDRILIIASTGGGKTEVMKALTPSMGPMDRVTIVSPVPELWKRLGAQESGYRYEQLYGKDPEACELFFDGVMKSGRYQCLILDEMDEYCVGTSQSKTGGYCCDALYRMINYGRNPPWCVGLLMSARGTADVTTNLIRSCNIVFIGSGAENNMVESAARFLGGREKAPTYERIIRNLPEFWFLGWTLRPAPEAIGYWKVINGRLQQVYPSDLVNPSTSTDSDERLSSDSEPPNPPTESGSVSSSSPPGSAVDASSPTVSASGAKPIA